MGSRSTNLRTKVVALLVSLAALWAFAAWVTLRDGLNLLWTGTYSTKISQPSQPLLLELQVERRMSVTYLGSPNAQRLEALNLQRERTDKVAREFQQSAQSWQTKLANSATLTRRISELIARLETLPATRKTVDDRGLDRAQAAKVFNDVTESMFRVYDAIGELDDDNIAADAALFIELYQARELMAQEDTLLAGALAAGRISSAELAQFAQLVGAQRFLSTNAVSRLPQTEQEHYRQLVESDAFRQLVTMEDRIIQSGQPGSKPPVEATDWNATADKVLTELQTLVRVGGDALVERAAPVAVWVIIRLVLAAGLGLLAVIASIVVSVTTARALVSQLQRLRDAAWRLADEQLPGVVARLGRGEKVDVATEAPPLSFGTDEIGQVGQAFNAVQETAIRTAVEQAELRRNVRDVFLSLARRTQALVHRQLTLLDAMERRETDAEELEDLFRIDHLATRMRRNAENLIVLSGSTPGRAWRRNVPMIDVVRGATAEVEDYTRVTVLPFGNVGLAGRAVSDVIHLIAELIENALSFSPPHTTVEVRGQMVANGYAIEIEDQGLGMSEEDLAAANEQIASQQEFNLANAARLGLFVVSRLTERHGIRAMLKESSYGGTTAVVLLPMSLVTEEPSGSWPTDPGSRPGGRLPATVAAGGNDVAQTTELPLVTGPVSGSGPAAQPRPTGTRPTPGPHPGPRQHTAATPDAGPPPLDTAQTPSGLPLRVRQANLAAPLRQTETPADEPTTDTDAPRPPEKIRQMMSSYQTGTLRGRSAAARLQDEETDVASAPVTENGPASGDRPVTD